MTIVPRIVSIVLAALVAGATWAEPNPDAPEIAPNLTLPNTQDGLTRVKWPREKFTLVTFGDQGGSNEVQAWAKAVRTRFGDALDYVAIAWLEAIPGNMKSTVETIIKTQHPKTLMDWSGSAADRFECKPGRANVFLVAPDGRILVAQTGPMPDDMLDRLETRIEQHKTSNKKGTPDDAETD